MLNILRNFDAAENGKKSTHSADKNSMKSILESLNKVSECGMEMAPMPPKQQGTPVSMNVSMNASGKENISDLIDLLKNAGMSGSTPMKLPAPAASNGHDDMVNLISMAADEHEPEESLEDSVDELVDEWDNEPDEEYKDDNYMMHDLAGGINRPKKSFAKAQDGDNAMAVEASIKEQLWAALNEKKQIDQNNDGKNDWEDVKIARLKASGKIKGKDKKKSS
jgi:hypothetical protein